MLKSHSIATSILCAALCACWTAPALAQKAPATAAAAVDGKMLEVSGVKLPYQRTIGGKVINLNGAGTRYKAIFKVYSSGLYTSVPVKTYAELKAAQGPKSVRLVFLRDLDGKDFGKMMIKGVEDNLDRAAFTKVMPGVMRLGEFFAKYKAFKPGDIVDVDYVPGVGTYINVRGNVDPNPIKEPEFFNFLSALWFGNKPVDWKLKDAMLAGGVK